MTWVQLFLEKGANPNYIDPYGNTPVSQAIIRTRGHRPSDNETQRQADRLKIIPLLIANGGDLTIRDSNNDRPIDKAGEIERDLIKQQLLQNIIYEHLMKQFSDKGAHHAIIYALLTPCINTFVEVIKKGNGTVKAIENTKDKLYYLPKELWTRIFAWVLSDTLTQKPALLHLLPYKERHVDTVESTLNYLLGRKEALKLPEEIEVEAERQLEDEWDALIRLGI